MTELLEFDFMRRALFATFCMAVLCPLIGIFLVLRRTSMTGDALSHSALAGVAVGLAGGVNPVGASFLFTAGAALLIGSVEANADSFLFGSLLTVTQTDLWIIGGLTVGTLGLGTCFYDRVLAAAFDEEAARAAGVSVRRTGMLYAVLTAAAVAASVRIAGVLVMSSMLTVPVATALQFRVGFKKTLALSVAVSLADAFVGFWLSTVVDAAPGGVIALTAGGVLLTVIVLRRVLGKA